MTHKYEWPPHWDLNERLIYQRWENEEHLAPWEERWIFSEVFDRKQKPRLRALNIIERERAEREEADPYHPLNRHKE